MKRDQVHHSFGAKPTATPATALIAVIGLLVASVGCRFTRSGSQAIDFDPFAVGTSKPALEVADGYGYVEGVPLDAR